MAGSMLRILLSEQYHLDASSFAFAAARIADEASEPAWMGGSGGAGDGLRSDAMATSSLRQACDLRPHMTVGHRCRTVDCKVAPSHGCERPDR